VPEKARQAGEKAGCPAFTDCREMLERMPEIDVCLIATPTYTHADLIEMCASYGKPTLCEKPLTMRPADADRILSVVGKTGIPCMTAQVVRFWTGYTRLKRMMADGEFGTIHMSYFSRCSERQTWGNNWLFDPEKGGGAMFDMMVHDVDFMLYLYGPAKKVYTLASRDDTLCYANVFASMEFESGALGVAETSFTMRSGYPFTMYAKIMGEKATAEFTYRAGYDINQRDGALCALDIYRDGQPPERLKPDQYDAYAAEIAYFLECLDRGVKPEVITPEESREVVRTVNAIERSAKTGLPVEMAGFKE
jgi:predicted dehydrogenase